MRGRVVERSGVRGRVRVKERWGEGWRVEGRELESGRDRSGER